MKMKIFLAVFALLAAASCTKVTDEVVSNQNETAPVTVRVSGFSIAQDEIPTTRGTEALDSYLGGGAITLAFYDAAGTEVYKTTQIKGDGTYTTFGEFTANLPVGNYTMVAMRSHSPALQRQPIPVSAHERPSARFRASP